MVKVGSVYFHKRDQLQKTAFRFKRCYKELRGNVLQILLNLGTTRYGFWILIDLVCNLLHPGISYYCRLLVFKTVLKVEVLRFTTSICSSLVTSVSFSRR